MELSLFFIEPRIYKYSMYVHFISFLNTETYCSYIKSLLWKTGTYLHDKVNIIAADDLVPQGARVSAARILT